MIEAAVAAPPQLSPDGQWWWTGAEWVPAHDLPEDAEVMAPPGGEVHEPAPWATAVPAQSGYVEPAHVEPAHVEPAHVEPAHVEPLTPRAPTPATMDVLAGGGRSRRGRPSTPVLAGALAAGVLGGGYYLTHGGSSSSAAPATPVPAHHVAAAVHPVRPPVAPGKQADLDAQNSLRAIAAAERSYHHRTNAYTSTLVDLTKLGYVAKPTGRQLQIRVGGPAGRPAYALRLVSDSGTPWCLGSAAGAAVTACTP